MKLQFITINLLALGLVMAQAQERVEKFDIDAAKAKLSGQVAKVPGKFVTKGIGGDPVKKRFYTKDAVVITRASGAEEKHPYVAVPLLFRVNSDELLDATSRENVAKVAQLLKEFGSSRFAIEGHASAEGDAQRNRELSKLRAARIQSLLREQEVPPASLARVDGFGSDHAQFPADAGEPRLQQDRRVLVVKER